MPTILFDKDKRMKELMLYIAQKSKTDKAFGATKLNKLLFYSDFLAYLNFGKAITDQDYQRLDRGPAPIRLLPLRRELIDEGAAKIESDKYFGFDQDRLVVLREPDIGEFSSDEIALVDYIIDKWWGINAHDISEESHRFLGWRYANLSEKIPYEIALVGTRDLTEKEIEYGKSLFDYELTTA